MLPFFIMESFIKNNYKYLIFTPETHQYRWHYSSENREIEVLISNEWLLQYENHLPRVVLNGDAIIFKNQVEHRLIPGKGVLVLRYKLDYKSDF